jgi:hypothetical protein
MYVQAVSNENRMIFPSMVYARINQGLRKQYVVYNKWKNTFELIDYVDKIGPDGHILVHIIQPDIDGFEEYGGAKLLKLKAYCKENNIQVPEVKSLLGYPDVCENHAFLCDIITNRIIPAEKYSIQMRDLPDINEWHYIQTQEDVDEFMKLFAGFHDSDLVKITYEESGKGLKKANAIFDNSGWFGIAELCFEGVQYLRIVPAADEYFTEILSATLTVDEKGVFWADTYMETPDMSYEGSIIRALSLKWRKLEDDQ